MGINSAAALIAAKSRPAIKQGLRALASGVLLAGVLYPAFASNAAPHASTTLHNPASKRAAISAATRFKYLGDLRSTIQAQPLPARLDKNEKVTVVMRMSVAPVAALREQRLDHKVTAAEHAAIHQQIDRQQADVEPAVVSRGGRVTARYRDALNGLKVTIARSEIQGLKDMPGVVDVLPVATYHMSNVQSVPFINAPAVWQGVPGYKGEGVKVAVIDTGIDYTHADFGGPGTVAAFEAAAASSTQKADPALFGPNAPKVKGGIDLVGDDYDAGNPDSVPVPDPNPLDCNGHGSHVSGTTAGFGVGSDGSTYFGPYNKAAYTKEKFIVGPGVAPNADLYAVRVFGCSGSTNEVVDAIDWAIDNDMDVINMSLGADFGPVDTADAVAVSNATKAGILVVASAGNAGPQPYLAGTPASGTGAIGVAAMDSHQFLNGGVKVTLSNSVTVDGVEANSSIKLPGKLTTLVLASGGVLRLGCDSSDYPASGVKGTFVIISRGSCTFAQKGAVAMAAGAAAIGVVNNTDGFLSSGGIEAVTIPWIELLLADTPKFVAAPSGTTASISSASLSNPSYRLAASFSSGGPRFGDSALRPNISAPGVDIFSTGVGTGNGGVSESGTSMASPHVAGVAALVREAHPGWTQDEQRAAIVDTAAPGKLLDYTPRIEGAGLVQPLAATTTQAVVVNGGQRDGKQHGLFFGFEEFAKDFKATRQVTLRNFSKTRMSFKVSTTAVGGVPHSASLSKTSISVSGLATEDIELTLSVPAKTVGGTHDADGSDAFREVAGYVTFTPTDFSNSGVAMTVPYYLVPRARSNAFAVIPSQPTKKAPTQSVIIANLDGAKDTAADFYAWGLIGKPTGLKYFDMRAVGVQSLPISADDSVLVFAINTWQRFSTADAAEFDISIDINNDGTPDFLLASVDQGYINSGSNNGIPITVLVDLNTGSLIDEFFVDAPTDGSSVLLPVLASDLGITPSSPRFSYSAKVTNLIDSTSAEMPGSASFNAFHPAISNGMFVSVPKGKSTTVEFTVDPVEVKKTPYLGVMIMLYDNFSGSRQSSNLLVARP